MARKVFLTALLIFLSNTIQTEVVKNRKFDFDFPQKLIRVYFCTGSKDWWKKINSEEQPMLRFVLHTGAIIYCENFHNFRSKEVLNELIKDAGHSFKHQTQEKREDVSECLWNGFLNWHLTPMFCPYPSEKFMTNYDESLEELYDFFCGYSHTSKGFLKFACLMGKMFLRELQVVRETVEPYLCCRNRQKRQYDISTLMAHFKVSACLKSSEYEHDIEKQIMDEGYFRFFAMHGSLCCVMKLINS